MEFKGTKAPGVNTEYNRYTGLESFQLVAVNPTKTELEELQGREISYDVSYDIEQDNKQNNVRPVVFYFKGQTAGIQKLQLNIGNEPAISNSGNYQVITSTGQIVWAKPKPTQDVPNPSVKPEFISHRPLVQGEAALITLLQKLLSFDRKSNEDFQGQLEGFKLDAKTLYDGDYKAFKDFVKSFGQNWITMPLVVVEKDEVVDGNTVTKLKNYLGASQYNLDKTVFSGEVSEWIKGQFQKNLTSNPDYALMQGLYTIDFMVFDKSKCLNNIPSNPTPTTNWG